MNRPKHVVLESPAGIPELRHTIWESAKGSVDRLIGELDATNPLASLAQVKFSQIGADPLDSARDLNLIEQVNQTFTYLVSLWAAEELFRRHPTSGAFELNLGTRGGFDVQALDGSVVAEAFAAVDPRNNSKLDKDIERVRSADARGRYVFFCAHLPQYDEWMKQGVVVVPISLETLLASVAGAF